MLVLVKLIGWSDISASASEIDLLADLILVLVLVKLIGWSDISASASAIDWSADLILVLVLVLLIDRLIWY